MIQIYLMTIPHTSGFFYQYKSKREAYRHAGRALCGYATGYKNILYEKSGKPYIENENISISISHTSYEGGGVVAVSFGTGKNGIDVQVKQAVSKRAKEKLLGFYSGGEQKFFESWVKYEARVKCLGMGIVNNGAEVSKIMEEALYYKEIEGLIDIGVYGAVCSICSEFGEPVWVDHERVFRTFV